jgi:hypothetical protein
MQVIEETLGNYYKEMILVVHNQMIMHQFKYVNHVVYLYLFISYSLLVVTFNVKVPCLFAFFDY